MFSKNKIIRICLCLARWTTTCVISITENIPFRSDIVRSTLTSRCPLSCFFFNIDVKRKAQNRGFLHISYPWIRIWTESLILVQTRNQPDYKSCWCTRVQTEEGTLFRDNSDFSTGNEMTPSFFIMLSGQLIALDTQINWMGVGVFSKRIWIYRISHLSTRDHVTLHVRPPNIPAKSNNKRGNNIGAWIGTLLDLSLMISALTACVFNRSLSHAIPWGFGADCLPSRGARLDCFCVPIVFLVNGT